MIYSSNTGNDNEFQSHRSCCLFTHEHRSSANHGANQRSDRDLTYGIQLDIQKVLCLTEEKIQSWRVQMSYLESQGQKRVLGYSKLAENCNDGN